MLQVGAAGGAAAAGGGVVCAGAVSVLVAWENAGAIAHELSAMSAAHLFKKVIEQASGDQCAATSEDTNANGDGTVSMEIRIRWKSLQLRVSVAVTSVYHTYYRRQSANRGY
jgi:hypothetical protein